MGEPMKVRSFRLDDETVLMLRQIEKNWRLPGSPQNKSAVLRLIVHIFFHAMFTWRKVRLLNWAYQRLLCTNLYYDELPALDTRGAGPDAFAGIRPPQRPARRVTEMLNRPRAMRSVVGAAVVQAWMSPFDRDLRRLNRPLVLVGGQC